MKKQQIPLERHLFDDLRGIVVSVLIDHLKPNSKLKESYTGMVMGNKNGFMCLHTDLTGKGKVKYLYVRHDQIISIWQYTEQDYN